MFYKALIINYLYFGCERNPDCIKHSENAGARAVFYIWSSLFLFSEQYDVSIFKEYIKELLFLRCNFIFHIRT